MTSLSTGLNRPLSLIWATILGPSWGPGLGTSLAAYNNMIVYPQSGSTSCPDLLIGLSIAAPRIIRVPMKVTIPTRRFSIRHCNGTYGFQTINPSITPAPSPIATRALAVSQFPGDPAGTIYAGGFDAHSLPAHNTDWVYKGVPRMNSRVRSPQRSVSDGLCSYAAATRQIDNGDRREVGRRLNNRAENSHSGASPRSRLPGASVPRRRIFRIHTPRLTQFR